MDMDDTSRSSGHAAANVSGFATWQGQSDRPTGYSHTHTTQVTGLDSMYRAQARPRVYLKSKASSRERTRECEWKNGPMNGLMNGLMDQIDGMNE